MNTSPIFDDGRSERRSSADCTQSRGDTEMNLGSQPGNCVAIWYIEAAKGMSDMIQEDSVLHLLWPRTSDSRPRFQVGSDAERTVAQTQEDAENRNGHARF